MSRPLPLGTLSSLFDRDCTPQLTRRTGGGGGVGANEAHGGGFGANEAHGGGGGGWR